MTQFSRHWAMPHKNTFSIKPIAELIEKWLPQPNGGIAPVVIDPFANSNKLATVTNDLSTWFDTDYHLDALEFLKMFDSQSIDAVLYDPPYSPRQIKECYEGVGWRPEGNYTQASFWGNQKNEISRIVKTGGIVISFGWNTNGIGKNRSFSIEEILLVAHGGQHNDTLCVVERKLPSAAPLF